MHLSGDAGSLGRCGVFRLERSGLAQLVDQPVLTTKHGLMFCIDFGLSMDYEVFLLSRTEEEHDRTGDNTAAVALGIERTGRIVTAMAALLAITFFAFGTSGVSFIKMFGIGLGIAVLMDATVVGGVLVSAFKRLAGEANCGRQRHCADSTTASASPSSSRFGPRRDRGRARVGRRKPLKDRALVSAQIPKAGGSLRPSGVAWLPSGAPGCLRGSPG